MWVYVLHPHTDCEVFMPYRSKDIAHFVSLLACDPDLLTLKLVRNIGRIMGYPCQFW